MSCLTCVSYTIDEDRKMGTCANDGRRNHPGYWCKNHELRGGADRRLGLTMTEVRWLRANPDDRWSKTLIGYYRMVQASPGDPGARAFFDVELRNWRRERPRGVLETAPRSAGNQAGTEESTHDASPKAGQGPAYPPR